MLNQKEELKKLKTESEEDYRIRCYRYKADHPSMSWVELTNIMNAELGANRDSTAYSKQARKMGIVASNPTASSVISKATSEDRLEEVLLEIKKERVKLSDERAQNQAYVRKLAREETLLEMAKEVARTMSREKQLNTPTNTLQVNKNREGILCISDWHYGIEVDNYFNHYSPVICCERLCKLRDEVIAKGKELNFTKLHVTNLSDLICGRIHLALRIESRFDAITQVMQVSEVLAEFLSDLSEHFEIEYRDCLDNHSRLEPNKKDSIELESLARLIPWYLEQRLANNDRIKILYNIYADDIISFKVFNWEVVAVHGHKDSPAKVISNMMAATRKRNDLVLSAHFHHFSGEEENECMRVSNGTLMGVDTHAQDFRLTSRPSQNLIVANAENVTEFICKINL
jgi:hypothetical protein